MEKELVTIGDKDGPMMKSILIFDEPSSLRPILNPLGWEILNLLAQKPMYPAEISRLLKIHEQKVYYHIRQMRKIGLLSVEKEEFIKGALARYYRVSYPAFGVELPFGEKRQNLPISPFMDEKMVSFFDEFLLSGIFEGCIVVGSPEPHGPYKASARDGHYAVQLAFYLGQFSGMPKNFIVKLDADVKAEKEERNNLILIGGPGTNLITADINRHLPIRFNEENYWAGLSDGKGRTFNSDRDGLIAKIPNPYDEKKCMIVMAGLKYIGTKSAVIAITNFSKEVLRDYYGERQWATVIRGFDLDGDGKVDSIEKLL
ncbi:MAG: ArsR family transcriptional regulator [Candidatus Methylarchaceae archaeon HK02M1]|nr:ArsR family transcriptional regulator [Candidatus Methylarchaceae archaeon HK01M]MCP8312483.1 ArsR family transcriptional regulator [Candidatus Methylarchaceae archaeon HK02M1]